MRCTGSHGGQKRVAESWGEGPRCENFACKTSNVEALCQSLDAMPVHGFTVVVRPLQGYLVSHSRWPPEQRNFRPTIYPCPRSIRVFRVSNLEFQIIRRRRILEMDSCGKRSLIRVSKIILLVLAFEGGLHTFRKLSMRNSRRNSKRG